MKKNVKDLVICALCLVFGLSAFLLTGCGELEKKPRFTVAFVQNGEAKAEITVEEGKKADLILLNIDQPHILPTQNLLNTIVDAASSHDVTDSIINGKLVMKDREVLTLDEEKIMFEADRHMKEIIKRAY